MSPFTDSELRDMGVGERQESAADRAPIHDGLPYHEFQESEFAPGCGRCDKCGGGPAAAIHQAPVDQQKRIADALERIAAHLESIRDHLEYSVERGALALERIAVGDKGPYGL